MRGGLGVLLAALLALGTGCAAGDGDDAAPSPQPAATSESASESAAEPADQATEISVAIADGEVDPAPHRVEVPKDSQVRLIVTSDVDDELHVHGYETEAELEAGRPTTVELTADQTGIFEVETHETGLELLQLVVR